MASQARGKSSSLEASASSDANSTSNHPLTNNDPILYTESRQIASKSGENIDKLLNNGRTGKGFNMGSSSGETSPRRRERDRDTESSADEETNIMRRSSKNNMSYQGTNSMSPQRKKDVKKRRPTRTEENEEDEAAEHQGWWAQVISKYGSIELENKGSVARDHLALERTFLAWLRTSLAFASIGIAITQLFRLNVSSHSSSESDRYAALRSMGKPLGATFLGISIVMLFIGFHRYFESQHWIIRGKFPASRGSIMLVALVTFALMVTSLVVVVVVEPGAREK